MSQAVSLLRLNPRLGKRERKTVGAAAVSLTESKYFIDGRDSQSGYSGDRRADAAIIQVFTDAIIWTIDGTTPAAGTGFETAAGDYIYLTTYQQIKDFRAVRKTTDAAIEAVFLF